MAILNHYTTDPCSFTKPKYLYTVSYLYMGIVFYGHFKNATVLAHPSVQRIQKKIKMYFSYSTQYLLPLKAIDSVAFRCRNAVRISLLIWSRDRFQVPKSLAHGFTYCNHHTTLYSKSGNKSKFLYLNYSTDEIPANLPAATAPSERKGQ